jgi:hypothetical protein
MSRNRLNIGMKELVQLHIGSEKEMYLFVTKTIEGHLHFGCSICYTRVSGWIAYVPVLHIPFFPLTGGNVT